MEESKLIRGNGTLLPRGRWPWSASSHPFSVGLGHLVVIGIFTNLPPRWNRTLLFSCQKAVVISGFQGGSFPKWEYTEILITLEMLSKPRCRALASATSPEHFIAHKSCSRLIKHCWSLPRSHEKVTHSPSLPTYQRLLLLLQRQSDFFFVLNMTSGLVNYDDFIEHRHFLCKETSVFYIYYYYYYFP